MMLAFLIFAFLMDGAVVSTHILKSLRVEGKEWGGQGRRQT